jgi:hypothetical protein
MWTGNQLGAERPLPYVRVVRIDENTKAVIDEPDIWNADYAFAYPDTSPNNAGEVGVTLFRGGGTKHPSHLVGVWDQSAARWRLKVAKSGTNGPADAKWGDYLTCRPHWPDGTGWLASGFTLQGGATFDRIAPQVVHFTIEES